MRRPDHPDMFAMRETGNRIPDSYLTRFMPTSPPATVKDDYADMPWWLQRFVDSVCAPHAYYPSVPVPSMRGNDDDD